MLVTIYMIKAIAFPKFAAQQESTLFNSWRKVPRVCSYLIIFFSRFISLLICIVNFLPSSYVNNHILLLHFVGLYAAFYTKWYARENHINLSWLLGTLHWLKLFYQNPINIPTCSKNILIKLIVCFSYRSINSALKYLLKLKSKKSRKWKVN